MSDYTPKISRGVKRQRQNPKGDHERRLVTMSESNLAGISTPGAKSAGKSEASLPQDHSGITPLPQQHARLKNASMLGCIVRQDFHCAVLADVLGQNGVDQCLSFHPNGLAVVQLAPTHPAVGEGDNTIVSVDFSTAGGCNLMESNIVTGKKKKGAMQLQPTTVLCRVLTRGGKHYEVCTGISGELIEVNKNLKDHPGLMSSEPLGRGWLVIVRLKPRHLRCLQEALGCVEER